ncbi:MAG: serine/threonine-protein phosphatase [Ruminococcus sp.]|nr:serine/threonine-protein phosphatase [Ruminococcus sp.]
MREKSFAFYSDAGGRANNEDFYLAKQIGEAYLFVVADGLGGHEAGEEASKIAVETIREYMIDSKEKNLEEAIRLANLAVLSKGKETSCRMKTTVAAAFVEKDCTTIAHVGDTRVYAFNNFSTVFRTKDHSASQLAVSVGEISEAEIRNHADRNILLRALGASEKLKVDTVKLDNKSIDSLLLCSDGFWEYVLDEEMIQMQSGADSADGWLYKMRRAQLGRAPDNCDNNTAVAVLI